ncbi:MAG TPA: hypothetical protein PKL28_07165 [Rhodocyclaceae bacterium]|nr:hypothetical protein [Rhodocyclaceae bacterium]
MTKLDDLIVAIDALPNDCELLQFRMRALISSMELDRLLVYTAGVKDTLEVFTSDEAYLAPIRKITEILK